MKEGSNLERAAHQRTQDKINAAKSHSHGFKKETDRYFPVKSTTHYHW